MQRTLLAWIVTAQLLFSAVLNVDTLSTHIRNDLDTKLQGPDKTLIRQIYDLSGYRPLWVGKEARVSQLLRALESPLFNYKNKALGTKSIKTLYYRIDNESLTPEQLSRYYARLDVALTNAYVKLIRFIIQGDVDWALVQKKLQALEKSDDIKARWEMRFKPIPSPQTLYIGATEGDLFRFLRYFLPLKRYYLPLVDMLERYRNMPNFPKVPYGTKVLKLGDRSPRISIIKKRLQITNDYPKELKINDTFDQALYDAILRFQARYLLKQDGLIDKVTTYYLNLTRKEHIKSITINLDKTKLYPERFEDTFIEVNIPDFTLRFFEDRMLRMKMGVVVGRIDRPTPIFEAKMSYLVLNPTWTIPDNLVRRDLIPVLKENPLYLQEHNIKVYQGNKEVFDFDPQILFAYEDSNVKIPFRFVQQPGDTNALGRVKFMFPNKYAVYLHDTDNKTLFKRRYKVYSSGCVRVEKPFELLDLILYYAKDFYSKEQLRAIMETQKPVTIRLRKPIPVHMVYFTAFHENGNDYFRNDIYVYDKIIFESSEGHRKESFTMPKNRLISVKKQRRDRLSN